MYLRDVPIPIAWPVASIIEIGCLQWGRASPASATELQTASALKICPDRTEVHICLTASPISLNDDKLCRWRRARVIDQLMGPCAVFAIVYAHPCSSGRTTKGTLQSSDELLAILLLHGVHELSATRSWHKNGLWRSNSLPQVPDVPHARCLQLWGDQSCPLREHLDNRDLIQRAQELRRAVKFLNLGSSLPNIGRKLNPPCTPLPMERRKRNLSCDVNTALDQHLRDSYSRLAVLAGVETENSTPCWMLQHWLALKLTETYTCDDGDRGDEQLFSTNAGTNAPAHKEACAESKILVLIRVEDSDWTAG
ncbi:hypothetical protein B0H17DRAFT_1136896 [Mycena rosella]|uniref:Uncharacterized protein n=1 Tax=Mycena rosella TaxID=1033263 RepID=A0AAD7DA21_MYCRO|nr:hypothetical protein B0H17DRAFT_1136896 [Mycena rosella]